MNRVLMIMAHPDDEVIFGWPILANEHIERYVLVVSENKHGQRGIKALEEICKLSKSHLVEFKRVPNNYYRLPPRGGGIILSEALSVLENQIKVAVDILKPNFIFTHNPWGEYGHGDHRVLFHISSFLKHCMLVTDINQYEKTHLSSNRISPIYRRWYESNFAKVKCDLNIEWLQKMKSVYEKHKAWSWEGHEVVGSCILYQF